MASCFLYMRLLVIGLDRDVADPDSRSAKRQLEYFRGYEADIVIMAEGAPKTVALSPQVTAHVAGGSNRALAWVNAARLARRLLKAKRPDVLTVQDPFFSGLAGATARCGLRTHLHIQDHSGAFARQPLGLKEKVLFIIARHLAKRADRVRTVSRRGAMGLERLGVDMQRVDIVPVASDVTRFSSLLPKTSAGAHLVCVSRLSYEKGVDMLLHALPKIRERMPEAHLTVVGDGPERTVLENLSARLGLADVVRFAGAQADTAPFLQDADVYVQPSRFEGWGIAVIEAAAASRPLVMTDVGCAGEVIRDGESGLVVPPQDPDALASAVIRLLTDRELAARLGRAAYLAAQAVPDAPTLMHRTRASLEAAARLRLLVITQRVDANDTNLGVHISWLRELATRADLTVIAQSVGSYELPPNVRVISLGKEKGASKLVQLTRLKWYTFCQLRRNDACLVLMVAWYAALAGWYGKLLRRPVYLWYTHKHVPLSLRVANLFVRRIFTASNESLRLDTKKKLILGHAIPLDAFALGTGRDPHVVKTIGRISRSKRLEDIAQAVASLNASGMTLRFEIIGEPVTADDKAYAASLASEHVTLRGGMPYADIAKEYQTAGVFVNASDTGSLDKAVLEAMATGCPVVTSNVAFKAIVPEGCFVPSKDIPAMAEAIRTQLTRPPSPESLRARVSHNDLSTTLGKLVDIIEKDLVTSL